MHGVVCEMGWHPLSDVARAILNQRAPPIMGISRGLVFFSSIQRSEDMGVIIHLDA